MCRWHHFCCSVGADKCAFISTGRRKLLPQLVEDTMPPFTADGSWQPHHSLTGEHAHTRASLVVFCRSSMKLIIIWRWRHQKCTFWSNETLNETNEQVKTPLSRRESGAVPPTPSSSITLPPLLCSKPQTDSPTVPGAPPLQEVVSPVPCPLSPVLCPRRRRGEEAEPGGGTRRPFNFTEPGRKSWCEVPQLWKKRKRVRFQNKSPVRLCSGILPRTVSLYPA